MRSEEKKQGKGKGREKRTGEIINRPRTRLRSACPHTYSILTLTFVVTYERRMPMRSLARLRSLQIYDRPAHAPRPDNGTEVDRSRRGGRGARSL